jgi:hypothetical protein
MFADVALSEKPPYLGSALVRYFFGLSRRSLEALG